MNRPVVHTKTQAEFDKVIANINNDNIVGLKPRDWLTYESETVIYIELKTYGQLGYASSCGDKILSYQEWENEFLCFKEGDYIVTLEINSFDTNCAKNNYCFKQRVTGTSIKPCVDLSGSGINGNHNLRFDKSRNLIDWRYATKEEIAEYDRLGGPYDVTTLNKVETKPWKPFVGEWVVFEPSLYADGVTKGCWDRKMILQVGQIDSDSLRFSYETLKRYDHYKWSKDRMFPAANGIKCFRKAFEYEIREAVMENYINEKIEEYEVGEWVLLSNNAWAMGWGGIEKDVNNKILKITKIENNKYWFDNFRTILKGIVRRAKPAEINEKIQISSGEKMAFASSVTMKFGKNDLESLLVTNKPKPNGIITLSVNNKKSILIPLVETKQPKQVLINTKN
jgi:hypothetical protein